ncbi:MAG TPA: class I SAM-dependent methyltransferase [Actinomycetota bacterium]|nr:class I SAM-dependent methyltransferase [Actinomycetota bacterium]
MSEPDYVARNVDVWTRAAPDYEDAAERNWASDEISWGIWGIPERDVGVLPDVRGLRVLELGCGTGYVSAWLARRGARPVGIDPTPAQLATAARLQRDVGPRFPLVRAIAERLPFRDASFDLLVSEYGAAIWSDPYRWVPEAARVLRPGGRLIFLGNGTLLMLCAPDDENAAADETLLRPYFGMHRFEWSEDESVEFHLGYGDWIRLFRANGLDVEDLVELRPPEGATTRYPFVTLEWARKWPCEEIWKVRKRA